MEFEKLFKKLTELLLFFANKRSWSEVQHNPPNITALQAMVPSGASFSPLSVFFYSLQCSDMIYYALYLTALYIVQAES